MLGERSDQRGLWEADRLYLDHVGREQLLRSPGIAAGPAVPGRRFRRVLLPGQRPGQRAAQSAGDGAAAPGRGTS